VLNRDGVVQRLRENLDDLYVMSMPPADLDLEDHVFLSNPLVLVACRAIAWRSAAASPWRTWVTSASCCANAAPVPGWPRTVSSRPKASRRPRGWNWAATRPSRKPWRLGLAVLSRHALRDSELETDLCVLPVQGMPIPSQWHVVHPRAKQLSPIAQVFAPICWAPQARHPPRPGEAQCRYSRRHDRHHPRRSHAGPGRALQQFADARDWGPFHSPKNLASALIVEAGELLEHFSGSPRTSRQLAPDAAGRGARDGRRAALPGAALHGAGHRPDRRGARQDGPERAEVPAEQSRDHSRKYDTL
jgi:hypothetical protein